MKVAVTLSSRDYDVVLFDLAGVLTISGRDGAAPTTTLCVDGEVREFVSGTTRVFRLDDEATDAGIHRDVTGEAR